MSANTHARRRASGDIGNSLRPLLYGGMRRCHRPGGRTGKGREPPFQALVSSPSSWPCCRGLRTRRRRVPLVVGYCWMGTAGAGGIPVSGIVANSVSPDWKIAPAALVPKYRVPLPSCGSAVAW